MEENKNKKRGKMNRNRYIVGLAIFLMAVLSIVTVSAGTAEDLCTECASTYLGVCIDNGCKDAGGACVAFDDDGDGILDTCRCMKGEEPVPELPSIVLLSIGLLALAGYVGLRRKKE
jgi:hypothetical protein